MRTEDKRQPAYTDTDKITFGKHNGELLQDVPPHYLKWLWNNGSKEFSKHYESVPQIFVIKHKVMLANYIHNSREAIEQELGDSLDA